MHRTTSYTGEEIVLMRATLSLIFCSVHSQWNYSLQLAHYLWGTSSANLSMEKGIITKLLESWLSLFVSLLNSPEVSYFYILSSLLVCLVVTVTVTEWDILVSSESSWCSIRSCTGNNKEPWLTLSVDVGYKHVDSCSLCLPPPHLLW